MIFFYWDKYFETGCDLMDSQHKDYINIIEELQKSVYAQDKLSFDKYSAELIEHLENHFRTENDLMKENHFPSYFSHRSEHDRFLEKTRKNLVGLNNKSTNEINMFFEITYRWFRNHLEINDRKLAKYIIDNKIV